MQLDNNEVFKYPVLSVAEYIRQYQPGLTPQGVSYAMDKDNIDYIRPGHERLVVLTGRTKGYVPNLSPKRGNRKPYKTKSIKAAIV